MPSQMIAVAFKMFVSIKLTFVWCMHLSIIRHIKYALYKCPCDNYFLFSDSFPHLGSCFCYFAFRLSSRAKVSNFGSGIEFSTQLFMQFVWIFWVQSWAKGARTESMLQYSDFNKGWDLNFMKIPEFDTLEGGEKIKQMKHQWRWTNNKNENYSSQNTETKSLFLLKSIFSINAEFLFIACPIL